LAKNKWSKDQRARLAVDYLEGKADFVESTCPASSGCVTAMATANARARRCLKPVSLDTRNRAIAGNDDRLARVRDLKLRDLIEQLELAVVVIEDAERRTRSNRQRWRLYDVAVTVDAAIDLLDELRWQTRD
jgi:hypothetical protein